MIIFKKTKLQEMPASCWECKDTCNLVDANYFLSPSKRMVGCPLTVKMSREEAIAILLKLQNGEGDSNAWDIADELGFKKEK